MKMYLCDPDKNIDCPKSCCAHNKQSEWPNRRLTVHKEYAILDESGKPVVFVDDEP